MWRAWGIILLSFSPQDLAPRVTSPDHEFALRPPAGWIRHAGGGLILAKFIQPGELKTPAQFSITHLHTMNPTPLEGFKRQTKDHIKENFPAAKVLEEKDVSIAGKQGYRVMYSNNDLIQFKTVIHRTNLEFYLLDATFPPDQTERIRPLIESSVATFEILPLPLSTEEKLLDARTTALIKAAKIEPSLLGERWFTIHLGTRKSGHSRFKLAESEGGYSFETDIRIDLGEGNTDTTTIRGSYAPDGRVQKVEIDETKINPKQKWVFQATAMIQSGQAKVSRNLNGVKEDRSFAVEDGVLLNDVAECMRAVLVGAGKGNYLLKTLSPYSEEWKVELIDVGGLESLEFDGKSHQCILVQAYVGRRKNMTYFYGTDRSVIRAGGHRERFAIRQSTKEEALNQ
jgi:hypothetical protein